MPRLNGLEPHRVRVGGLHELAPLRAPRRLPWWAVPAAVLALGGLGALGWHLANRPQEIADVALVGDRSPAALDVVLLLDESGSFSGYAAVREEAIAQVTSWAPANLRADDRITIIGFAGDAVVRMPPTTVADIAAGRFSVDTTGVTGGGTAILPALAAAEEDGAERGTTTLVSVTDTLVSDADEDAVADAVARLHATTATVITPTGVGVMREWRQAFSWEHAIQADPGSAGSTSLAVADALAHATGQQVQRR